MAVAAGGPVVCACVYVCMCVSVCECVYAAVSQKGKKKTKENPVISSPATTRWTAVPLKL